MCPFTYGVHSVHDSAPPSFLKDGDGGARRIAQFINKLLTTKSRKRARKGASAAIKDLDDKMRRFFWLHLPDQLTRHIQAGISCIYFPPNYLLRNIHALDHPALFHDSNLFNIFLIVRFK